MKQISKFGFFIFFFQLLWERFKEFARDTEAIGSERVASVNGIADDLIANGHSDSAKIAELKDQLNELWQDLLELIDTRTQVSNRLSQTPLFPPKLDIYQTCIPILSTF